MVCLSYTHLVHLRFGRPLLLFPGVSTSSIFLTMCSSLILITLVKKLSRFSVIFLDACATLIVHFGYWGVVSPSIPLSFRSSIAASSSHLLIIVLLVLSCCPGGDSLVFIFPLAPMLTFTSAVGKLNVRVLWLHHMLLQVISQRYCQVFV